MTCMPDYARCGLAALLGSALALAGCGQAPPEDAQLRSLGSEPFAALIVEARSEMALGDLAEAGRLLDEARALEPENPALWVAIARLRFRGGEHLPALDAAEYALELDPDYAPALLMRAQLVRDAHGFVDALAWYDAAAEAGPNDPDILVDRAATLGEAGEYRAMLDAIRELDRVAPADNRGHFLRAVLAARAGEPVLARTFLQRSELSAAGVPSAMLLDALIDLAQGNEDSAASTLEQLHERQPGNVRVAELHARALWLGGRDRQLLDAYGESARAPDASPYLAMLAGRALERSGDRAAAAPLLERAVKSPSTEFATLSGNSDLPEPTARMRALLANGETAAALNYAAQLIEMLPGSSDIRGLAGDAALAAGRAEQALAAYRDAALVRRPWPLTRKAIAAYRQLGDEDAADVLLARHARGEPNNAEALLMLARRAAQRGDWSQAATILDRVIALGEGSDPGFLRLRANVARELGQDSVAQGFEEQARVLVPPALTGV
jgi:tetratricopeptide (TPR) repeat protein